MEKISVKICTGTTCYVMGGANLQELYDIIPERYGNKVELNTTACLGFCNTNGEYSKAPYVKVNEEVVSEATAEKVIAEIDKQLAK